MKTEYIQYRLEDLKIGYTTTICGQSVTRWSIDRWEIGTWGKSSITLSECLEMLGE